MSIPSPVRLAVSLLMLSAVHANAGNTIETAENICEKTYLQGARGTRPERTPSAYYGSGTVLPCDFAAAAKMESTTPRRGTRSTWVALPESALIPAAWLSQPSQKLIRRGQREDSSVSTELNTI